MPETKTPEQQIREALQNIAKMIGDAAELNVVTSVKVMDPNDPEATKNNPVVEVASTVIKIEGDRNVTLPVVTDNVGGFAVPQAIFDAHQKNVEEAMQYRAQMLATLVDFIKTRRLG